LSQLRANQLGFRCIFRAFEHSEKMATKPATATKELEVLEEDDEFEEFEEDQWGEEEEDKEDIKQWAADWDDDMEDDAFAKHLRAELDKNKTS